MKLTESMLRKIIKEEVQAVLNEEEKAKLSREGAETHRKNLEMAKTMDAKELAAKMKLPNDFETINDYKTYVGLSNMKLGRAINIVMRSGAAKKIHGTRM